MYIFKVHCVLIRMNMVPFTSPSVTINSIFHSQPAGYLAVPSNSLTPTAMTMPITLTAILPPNTTSGMQLFSRKLLTTIRVIHKVKG